MLALLAELNRELGITILLATHATEVAAAAGRIMRMRDGTARRSAARAACPTVLSRLFRQFILRRMAQERARTATTVVGIALGIAVVIAIQLTNASSVRGFETALDTVAGRASVEIAGPGRRGRDAAAATLGWLREFGAVSPVIEGEMAAR